MSKLANRRLCPAVQREITSAECGENRGSRYACPANCSFSPLASANYSQLLALEQPLDNQCLQRLDEDADDPIALKLAIRRAMARNLPHELHSLIAWLFLYERDAEGHTCAQRWERDGFPGLKNDARVLLRAKMQLRVGLIEILQVIDAERTEVVDLLGAQPQRLIIMDRGLASAATRFGVALTWLYPLPHYCRIAGAALFMKEIPGFEPREVLEIMVRHLGGPLDEAGIYRWLAKNFVLLEQALEAVGTERRRLTLMSIDVIFGQADYELLAPLSECRDQLEAMTDMVGDVVKDDESSEGFTEAWDWLVGLDHPDEFTPGPSSRAVLGRVLGHHSRWRVEAMSGKKFALLRKKFEARMGTKVRFISERLDDLIHRKAAQEPRADLSLVPPRLLENLEQIQLSTVRTQLDDPTRSPDQLTQEFFTAQDRIFLDDSIPDLDGRTPREAARDPQLRPKLIRLIKSRVRITDQRNLQTGRNDDINWMVRELGLDEIDFAAPPPGRVPRTLIAQNFSNNALSE